MTEPSANSQTDNQLPDDAELAKIEGVALQAAQDAGEILLQHLGKLNVEEIQSKSVARDLCTQADVASERLLVQRLRAAFPQHAIEAEEETKDALPKAGSAAAETELRWFLDPLDGTTNFVHQLPTFGVSMGLFYGSQPVVAVVHLPRLQETFSARLGQGTRLNGQPVHVRNTEHLGDAILATGFPYRRNELEHNNLANFGRFFLDVRGMRRMGSAAMDLAYVAAGRFDGYWELHLSPHDVAAGALLVKEAGGQVTDADGGQDWLRGGSVVAANPVLAEQLRARVQH